MTPQSNQQIDAFLADLRTNLAPIAPSEREEILREIAAHIYDSIELTGLPASAVLAKLGSPQQLAAGYRDGALVREASYSVSPTRLLRATLRIATKGLSGAIVFFLGLVGYITGLGFVIAALLKPFFPEHTGVFVLHSYIYSVGVRSTIPAQPIHEIAGFWFIPLSLTVGSLALVLTTLAIRRFLRLSSNWQQKFINQPTSEKPTSTPA
jgi:uncharacterized membrane protein